MKRLQRVLLLFALLASFFAAAFFVASKVTAQTCTYAVCDRSDRLNPKAAYELINYDTIIGTYSNGKTVSFRAQINDPKKQVIDFEAPQSAFCFIPGKSDGSDPKGRHIRVRNPNGWPPNKNLDNINIDIFAFENGKCVDPAQGSAALLVSSAASSSSSSSSSRSNSSGGGSGTVGPGTDCKKNFLFLPPWNKYLDYQRDEAGGCRPADSFEFPTDLLAVGLAILEMLIRLAGFVAVISLIIAGVQYITSGGNSEKAGSALRRIYNSFIGLAIVLIAVPLISYLGNRLG